MTAHPVSWTRAERTREIGYADAMFEIQQMIGELRAGSRAAVPEFITGVSPEAAYAVGAISALELLEQVRTYAKDAYLLHVDPRFFSECAARLAEGGYGTSPAEPGGDAPEDSGTGGVL